MDRLVFARAQMTVSLVFHIVFAAIGIALPLALFIVEGLFLATRRAHYHQLAMQWAKATGLVFAVGAVSGTALSFELGLLWPRYIEVMGAAVGHAFALEGFAFFIEAIFIGLYLYGRDRMSDVTHWLCGGVIALSGLASGALVLAANAWMQMPVGFTLDSAGKVIGADPLAIFRTPTWINMTIHSTFACYIAIPLFTAGVYAVAALRGRTDSYVRGGLLVSMAIGGVAALAQPISGDALARFVFRTQPAKFAAMESNFVTRSHAPLHVFGVTIPDGLSFLAAHDFNARVTGLDDLPRDRWPNVAVVHTAFDVMVTCGSLIALASALFWIAFWRGREELLNRRRLLQFIALVSPLGIVGLEAGWVVTEAGRQPWIIQGVMLTRDAVTPSQKVPLVFFAFALLYLAMGITVIVLLRRLAHVRSE